MVRNGAFSHKIDYIPGAGGKRGGKAGRQAVNQRFTALALGNWGRIVELWEGDVKRWRQKREERVVRRRTRGQEKEEKSLRRKSFQLISSGQVGKVESRINSNGIASMDDPRVRAQMASKYPARARELPDQVPMGQAVHNLRGLREGMKGLRKRTAPGSGGLRPEFLIVLGEKLEAYHMALLEDWGMRYLQGELPPWFSVMWLSVETVPLYKSKEKEAVRLIGMRNPLAKLLHRMVVRENEADLVAFFEPQQIALSKGGASKLMHSVQLMMEKEELRREQGVEAVEEIVVCKIDTTNAFNSDARASPLQLWRHW